jgi:dUTPase
MNTKVIAVTMDSKKIETLPKSKKKCQSHFNTSLCVSKLLSDAYIPRRIYANTAGYILFSHGSCYIKPNEKVIIDTYIRVHMPFGVYGWIAPINHIPINGIEVIPSIVNPCHTDQLKVVIYNNSKLNHLISSGSEIAQLILTPYIVPKITDMGDSKYMDMYFTPLS